jgi:hypothetical protein
MRGPSSNPTKNSACHGPSQRSTGQLDALVSRRSIPTCGKGSALLESDNAEIHPGPHQ